MRAPKQQDPAYISTDTVSEGAIFRPHGRIAIYRDHEFLMYEAVGPFNDEMAQALAKAQAASLTAQKFAGPWSSIATFRTSILATPNAIEGYQKLMAAPKPPGWTPAATAFVCEPNLEGLYILKPKLYEIYSGIGRPLEFFTEIEEAKSWCRKIMHPDAGT